MSNTDFLSILESTIKEKAKKFKKTDDPPRFARVSDQSVSFQGGFLYSGKTGVNRPDVFLGVYRGKGRNWLYCGYYLRLRIPESLRGSAQVFCNRENAAGNGLFLFPFEGMKAQCTFAVLANCSRRQLAALLRSVAEEFECAKRRIVDWMKQDDTFLRGFDSFHSEIALLSSLFPSAADREAEHKDYAEAATRFFRKSGLKKPIEIFEEYGRTVVKTQLPASGPLSAENCQSFPIVLTISGLQFRLQILFGENRTPYSFRDISQEEKLLTVLATLNGNTLLECFNYDSQQKSITLERKTMCCLIAKTDIDLHMETVIYGAVETYRASLPCLQSLQRNERLEAILSHLAVKPPLPPAKLASDSFEASDAASFTASSSEEAKVGAFESLQPISADAASGSTKSDSALNRPITSFCWEKAEQFKKALPGELWRHFCLDKGQLDREQLVYWQYDARQDQKETVRIVVDGFIQLRKLGIEFERLPLDAATLSHRGNLVLMPTFSPNEMSLRRALSKSEEEAERFAVSSKLLTFLATSVSREKHITLASFKVFRVLQDIDFIPPSRFLHSSLLDFDLVIGRGGFGEVFRNEMNGIPVALKTVKQRRTRHRENEQRKSSREYLKPEFRLMQACTHPNVVRIFGYTKWESRVLLVMELCSNGALSKYLHTHTLSLHERIGILLEVADALTLMHAKNIAHFDIKPQNILLSDDLTPKICDFGLSQTVTKTRDCKASGFTLMYAPPEQVRKGKLGLSADVWSFGILVYYTLFGEHPFDYVRNAFPPNTEKKVIYDWIITHRCKPLFSREFESSHPRLVHLMRSCLRLNPAERPSFDDLVLVLDAVYQSITADVCSDSNLQ